MSLGRNRGAGYPVKLTATLGLALGVAIIVAGGLSFSFGLNSSEAVVVSGAGPFDGRWDPPAYCFLGTVLAAGGAGLAVFCLAWTAIFFRHGSAAAPRRRWLLWSLVLAAGVGGVGVGATVLVSPRVTDPRPLGGEAARMQVAILVTKLSDGKDVRAMTTAGYQQRERERPQTVRYEVATVRTASTDFHGAGSVIVTGSITATAKMTSMRLDGGALAGAGLIAVQFDPPREIGYTARLAKGEHSSWLVDELVFDER